MDSINFIVKKLLPSPFVLEGLIAKLFHTFYNVSKNAMNISYWPFYANLC